MRNEYADLIKEVCECLHEVAVGFRKIRIESPHRRIGNGEWTKAILHRLYECARGDVCGDRFSACPAYEKEWQDGEWLYDMIWYKDDPDFKDGDIAGLHRSLKEVVLVLESEWSHSNWDIQYDFEKLLVAKSPIKVMIVDDVGSMGISIVENGLKRFDTRNYGVDDYEELYLLAQYENASGDFAFWLGSSSSKILEQYKLK